MSETAQNPEVTEEVKAEEVAKPEEVKAESTAKTAYTPEEYAAIDARMRAADKNRSDVQKALDKANAALAEIEKSKLSDIEKATLEAKEHADKATFLEKELTATRMTNAFLKNNSVVWADADDAYTILNKQFMEGVEIDDTGKVTGLDDAIKAMVKAKPHLVKSAGGVVEPSSEATGSNPVTRKGDTGGTSKVDLSRFPAMGRKF